MIAHAPISAVYRMGEPDQVRDPMDDWARAEMLRRRAWQQHGLIVCAPKELPPDLANAMEAWANDNRGRRG